MSVRSADFSISLDSTMTDLSLKDALLLEYRLLIMVK